MKIFYVLFATHSRPSASGVYRFGDQYFEVQEELEAEAAAANGCSRGGGEYYDSDGVCCYGEEEGLFGDEEDFEEEEDVDVGAFVAGDEDEELLAAEARSGRGGGICLEGDDVEEEALLVMQVKTHESLYDAKIIINHKRLFFQDPKGKRQPRCTTHFEEEYEGDPV